MIPSGFSNFYVVGIKLMRNLVEASNLELNPCHLCIEVIPSGFMLKSGSALVQLGKMSGPLGINLNE